MTANSNQRPAAGLPWIDECAHNRCIVHGPKLTQLVPYSVDSTGVMAAIDLTAKSFFFGEGG